MKKLLLFCLALLPCNSQAINYLAFNGSEDWADDNSRSFFFGPNLYFLPSLAMRAEAQHTENTKLEAGPWLDQPAFFNQVRPNLDSGNQLGLYNLRYGQRGHVPLLKGTDYSFKVEAGHNALTEKNLLFPVTWSLTFSQLQQLARLRLGQMEIPGMEEGQQSVFNQDYINHTNVSAFLVNEPITAEDGTIAGHANLPVNEPSSFSSPAVQWFNWYRMGSYELSWAAGLATGDGLNRGNQNTDLDQFAYLSMERVFDSVGILQQGLKGFAWAQRGTRELLTATGEQAFERDRYGAGIAYYHYRWRLISELVKADGMIFAATDGGALPGRAANVAPTISSYNIGASDKGQGGYVDVGYFVKPMTQLNLRYDETHITTESAQNYRRFRTVTFSLKYFPWNDDTFWTNLSYEFRQGKFPFQPSSFAGNTILETIDSRIGAQAIYVFQ